MKSLLPKALWAILGLICATTSLGAADIVIKGVVSDSAGKPIQGAAVRVSAGIKTVSRFTQPNGRYEITVPSGNYEVAASAFGFAAKRATVDATQATETNFTLSPVGRESPFGSGSKKRLIPDDAAGKMLKGSCTGCTILRPFS